MMYGAVVTFNPFEILIASNGQNYWRVKARNGEILAHSETYSSRQKAEQGILATVKTVKQDIYPKFEVVQAQNGAYYWRLKAANGEILCVAETYSSQQAAYQGVETFKTVIKTYC